MKHLKLTPTAKLNEAEWQTLRQSFVTRGMVGGSDAGTLLGLNKYKSPINLFYQAIGISTLPNKMNHIMLHGKQLEDYVAKCWQYYDGTEDGWVENTLKNNKIKSYRKVKAIIEGRRRGVEFIYQNPKEAALIVAKAYAFDPVIMEEAILALAKSKYWSTGELDLAGMNAMAEGLKLTGAIDSPPNWNKLIDRSFLKK